jgi:hypothetical protein
LFPFSHPGSQGVARVFIVVGPPSIFLTNKQRHSHKRVPLLFTYRVFNLHHGLSDSHHRAAQQRRSLKESHRYKYPSYRALGVGFFSSLTQCRRFFHITNSFHDLPRSSRKTIIYHRAKRPCKPETLPKFPRRTTPETW